MASGQKDVKLVIVGDSDVGKTCMIHRFVQDVFYTTGPTIGASFRSKNVMVDDKSYKFQIWDTAGEERYRSLTPMYYRGAEAAIVVYDITKHDTFALLKYWVQELIKYSSSHVALAIAGNKVDLELEREVPTKDASKYANDIGAIFLETSAKTGENVVDLFKEVAKRLSFLEDQPRSSVASAPNGLVQPSNKRSCCFGRKKEEKVSFYNSYQEDDNLNNFNEIYLH